MHGRETNFEQDSRKHGVGERSGNGRDEPAQRSDLPLPPARPEVEVIYSTFPKFLAADSVSGMATQRVMKTALYVEGKLRGLDQAIADGTARNSIKEARLAIQFAEKQIRILQDNVAADPDNVIVAIRGAMQVRQALADAVGEAEVIVESRTRQGCFCRCRARLCFQEGSWAAGCSVFC